MTMTRKQLKAIRLRKAIRKDRNVRTNNESENPRRLGRALPFRRQSHTYRLYNI